MILLLMAAGVVIFLLFSRKGKESFSVVNRIFENPVNNTKLTVTGETVDYSENEYIRLSPPDNPKYYDFIYLHTPTNVRVRINTIHVPPRWIYPYYPYFLDGRWIEI